MIRTQLYLPQQQHDRLKALALKQRTSVSSVIRQLVDEKIDPSAPNLKSAHKKAGAGQWLLDQARMAEEIHLQGPTDLASKVDKYLYGR